MSLQLITYGASSNQAIALVNTVVDVLVAFLNRFDSIWEAIKKLLAKQPTREQLIKESERLEEVFDKATEKLKELGQEMQRNPNDSLLRDRYDSLYNRWKCAQQHKDEAWKQAYLSPPPSTGGCTIS